jgi:hypothetical protein
MTTQITTDIMPSGKLNITHVGVVNYLFLNLEVTDGERAYNCLSVHLIHSNDYLDYAKQWAKSFYGDPNSDSEESIDGGWYQVGGEVYVKLHEVKLITKTEYEVLKRFL